ncbi:hypothetical protein C0992_006727, partial [Termitomyces sp. T32_za158]
TLVRAQQSLESKQKKVFIVTPDVHQVFKTAKALAAEEQKVIKASKKTGKSKSFMQVAPSDAVSDFNFLTMKATQECSISSDKKSLPPVS